MADNLPVTNKRRRGRPSTNIKTHPNWPLLIELHEGLVQANGRGIVKLSRQLAPRAHGGGTDYSLAKWLERNYRTYRNEITAEVTAKKRRARNEAALAAALRADQKNRRAINRAFAATVSLDQHPAILRLQEQQRERDRLAAMHDPLRLWRHLLDE